MATRVGMVSLGCPKNQVDAEHMLYDLRKEGFQIVSDAALSDVVIINTCGFIESATAAVQRRSQTPRAAGKPFPAESQWHTV